MMPTVTLNAERVRCEGKYSSDARRRTERRKADVFEFIFVKYDYEKEG